jgi:hypothetical protein
MPRHCQPHFMACCAVAPPPLSLAVPRAAALRWPTSCPILGHSSFTINSGLGTPQPLPSRGEGRTYFATPLSVKSSYAICSIDSYESIGHRILICFPLIRCGIWYSPQYEVCASTYDTLNLLYAGIASAISYSCLWIR